MEIKHMRYPDQRIQTKRQRPKRIKKAYVLIGVIVFVIPLSLYAYVALTKPLPLLTSAGKTIKYPASQPAISWPGDIDAAVGTLSSGLLAQSSANEQPRSIASIAKVITALAVISKKPISSPDENIITFGAADEALYHYYESVGGSNLPIAAGNQLSEYYALEAMLVPSSNNIADSLALWAFGSIDAYSKYANAMVKSFGLTKTSVGEASGFNDSVLSTPSDLVILGQKLLQNNLLARIVRVKNDTLPGLGLVIHNTNLLLREDVEGIKTGHTSGAGYCLLLTKNINIDDSHSAQIISAVLGASSSDESFAASDSLTTSIKKSFTSTIIVPKGSVVGIYTTPWGSRSDIITNLPLITYGWEYAARSAQSTPKSLNIPQTAGGDAGIMSTHNDGGSESTVRLSIKDSIKPPSTWWRLAHYF